MPTIDEQLTELVAQKNSLAANLNTMGVTASESETLNTLVPKVLDIPTGGSSAVVQPLSVAQNGTYNPPSGVDGYAPVTVNVSGGGAVVQPLNVTQNGDYYPSSGTDGFDEVHVAVPSATLTTKNITQNGTYNASSDNADGYSSVVVNVSGGGGGAVVQPLNVTQNGDYFPPAGTDGFNEVHVSVSGGYPEPTGTIQITENGTVNVKDYASAEVNVPNSYAASDEGKVVKNGTLISQTARATEINTNGTYDTTENNSVIVNVSGGGGGAVVQPLSVTQNGTYNPPSGVDGYAPVTVNVSGGEPPTMIAEVTGGSFNSDGITVNSQPVITDGEISANASNGLTFLWNCNRLVFEFDMNMAGDGGGTVFSFGGSNTNNGVLIIDTATFMLYANAVRFSESISLSLGETYHTKIELTPGTAKLYIDGLLVATGVSTFVDNVITYIRGGNQIGVLYNQSYHPEYNKSRINNLKIYM